MKIFKEITGLSLATLLAVGLAACGSSAAKENDAQKGQTVGDQVDYTIVGTDPGSGLMQATEKARLRSMIFLIGSWFRDLGHL